MKRLLPTCLPRKKKREKNKVIRRNQSKIGWAYGKKLSSTQEKTRSEALERLGVTEEALSSVPPMTELFREACENFYEVIVAMRFSSDPVIADFLKLYITLSDEEKSVVPLEAVALAAGIEIPYLIGAVLMAIRQYTVDEVKVIAMMGHPDSMRARVSNAKLIGGYRDREALDIALGFLPKKREGATIINFGPGGTLSLPDGNEEDSEEPDLDQLFPDVSQMQKRIAPIRQEE